MIKEDFKIGAKYTSFQKTIGDHTLFNDWSVGEWAKAVAIKQPYLYLINIGWNVNVDGNYYLQLGFLPRGSYDGYAFEDVKPFGHHVPDRVFLKDLWNVADDKGKKVLEKQYPSLKLHL